ncbi:MAG TPA: adenosylmethionine decarboxylase [Dehalococcoidales bacterium]
MNALGKHLLVELNDCDRELLNDLETIRDIMLAAAIGCGATVLGESFHRFSPHGISGVIIIAESHLTIHTWPEYGYAAADVFTCGTTVQPEKAVDIITERFKPRNYSVMQMFRGTTEVKEKVIS